MLEYCLQILMTAGEAPAAPPAGGPGPAPGGGLFQMLVPFLLMFMIFYFLIIRPESRKRKERERRISGVQKGDTVYTSAGIIGKVWRAEGNEVVLVIDKDKDVKMSITRNHVFDMYRKDGDAGAKPQSPKGPADEAKS